MAQESGRQLVQSIIAKLNANPDMEDRCNEEIQALDKFVVKYKNAYDFSNNMDSTAAKDLSLRRPGTQDNVYVQLFQLVLELRFLEGRWQQLESGSHRLVVLQCIRLFMRDKAFQRRFLLRGGRDELCSIFEMEGSKHYRELSNTNTGYGGGQILLQIASMLTKLDADVLVHCRKTSCYLLSTTDPYLLQCVLIIMHRLCQSNVVLSQQCKGLLILPAGDGAVRTGEKLLQILESQKKLEFRELVAQTLINACTLDEENRDVILANDGIRAFLGLVQQAEDALLVLALQLLEVHAMDPDASRQVRTLGGINVILNMINSRADEPNKRRGEAGAAVQTHAVLEAGCLLLTRLAFDDENSTHIRQLNGVFVLAKLMLHQCDECTSAESTQIVQAHALQALRLLFSLERNRRSFKRIFSPALFEKFIEIGQYQYQRDVAKYLPLAALINALDKDKRDQIDKAIREMMDTAGVRKIQEYVCLGEPIGKGGFGTIYRARREGSQTFYALKEIRLEYGATDETEQETHREVALLQQMDHPNIVKYVDSFAERFPESQGGGLSSLFIVMELVEGSSIKELIESKREKGEFIAEKQIREVVLQICHALYYIHKKKNITHRDLTPNNILLSTENDALTNETILRPILVDFGLARQRYNDNSVMSSVVGTLTYSCPELIERKPYTDKADIWSLGVIMYEMVCLTNPFMDTNYLQAARRIVEGDFKPIEDEENNYSEDLKKLITKMMNPQTKSRPDVVQVMMATSCWDRLDRTTTRDEMERTDELYIRTKELEEKAKRLQDEKDRLEAVVRGQHGSLTLRGANPHLMLPHTPYAPYTPGTPGGGPYSPVRKNYLPTTPGAAMPLTPGSAAPRHFPQTPGGKSRPGRGPSLRVPANSVKEIDPAGQMLNQLHKIVFVTQLPPDMEEGREHARMRRAVEKYKRALFSRAGQGKSLKQELQKLLSYSEEVIDVDFYENNRVMTEAASPDGKGKAQVTYEYMCRVIETLLKENHYYDDPDDQPQPDTPLA